MTTLAVTSAGRRRYVVEALLAASSPGDTLVAVDVNGDAPALSVPGVVGAVAREPGALPLLDLLRELRVDAALSLHDYEAVDIARHIDDFDAANIRFIGADFESATTVIDKLALAAYIAGTAPGLEVPTHSATDIPDSGGPWVLKDRYGSGSSGLEIVTDRAEVGRLGTRRTQRTGWHPSGVNQPIELVAQPLLVGREFNLDLFFGAPGDLRGHCLKEKGSMRGGETDTAHVRPDAFGILERVHDALRGLRFVGNVDVDVILGDDELSILDVNPRFGGGYAFSVLAGYDAARSIWTLARREVVSEYHTPGRELRAAKYVAVAELVEPPDSGIAR